MDLNKEKYIILELIPNSLDPINGDIVQFSALKLDGIKLIDRFDYRLEEDKVFPKQFLDIINYDKDSFVYVSSKKIIMDEFKKWANDLPLLIIDNQYTFNYLKDLDNVKDSIFKYLGEEYSDDIFEKIMKKYNLEPSNYLVDILYEALIREL